MQSVNPSPENSPQEFFHLFYGGAKEGYLVFWTKQDNATFACHPAQFPMIAEKVLGQAAEKDVYFGVGLQREKPGKGSRGNAEGVMAIPGLWLDIDIGGDGHSAKNNPPTVEAALEIINAFPHTPTVIIHTGGGLHVYWRFSELWVFNNRAERKARKLSLKFQRYFIQAARDRGWHIDNTADLARVLRVPGTFNRKLPDPRPVYILQFEAGNGYAPEDFEAFLPDVEETQVSQGKAPNPDLIVDQCPWMKHCRDDAATLNEPEWYAVLSIIARCENGEALAHEWSKSHPGYTHAETDRKIRQALGPKSGPRTCKNIRENGGEFYCQDCPHWGKIKSPISMGRVASADDHIAKTNEKHAVVPISGKTVILTEIIDPALNRPDVVFSSPGDIKILYGNILVEVGTTASGKPKYEKLGNFWIDHPDRRQYKGVVFAPEYPPCQPVDGYYNLYRGFAVEPVQGDWSLFEQHIYEVISNGNQEIFDYLKAWMAHLVQFPGGQRPGTALVLRGSQGTGKGCFVSQFGLVFGQHFLHLSSPRQLTGRFNSHLKDALLVFADEALFGGDKAAAGTLKSMITEDLQAIEPKGVDLFMVKNHIRLIIASNHDWVVPAGFEERRFCVLDVSDKHMQDKAYFRKIFEQMDNGGREAMLYDLLCHDFSGIDLRTIPRTEALVDQILRGADTTTKYWFERLTSGMLPTGGWGEVASGTLYEDYVGFAKQIGDKYPAPDSIFSRKLRVLIPKVDQRRPREESGLRTRYWIFPGLEECRTFFSEKLNFAYEWPEPGDPHEF